MPASGSPISDPWSLDPPRRVVSLVPSLTEAVAAMAPQLLVGATDYCTHPADLDVPRVGGTKYPSIEAVVALRPDLVLANVEENRREDIETLKSLGVPAWVCFPRTLQEAFESLDSLASTLGVPTPGWLDAARLAWAALSAPYLPIVGRRAVVPVWRRPWVVLGNGTFAGDLLTRLGFVNVYADAADRYPRPSLDELRSAGADLVVFPDEPYAFTWTDGPESFPGVPFALVSGRHLTWYGPSLVDAPTLLAEQLATA